MQIRDRIRELRRVPARELRPHPRNWRTHGAAQRDALRGVLAEVGYADALLARELDDGSLQLIDGHLRAETTPEALVPVLVLDVSAEEAAKLLLTLDPLAGMAGQDQARLEELLAAVEFANPQVQAVLDSLARDAAADPADEPPPPGGVEPDLPESWQVVVECASEEDQRTLFDRLTGEGRRCRVLTL